MFNLSWKNFRQKTWNFYFYIFNEIWKIVGQKLEKSWKLWIFHQVFEFLTNKKKTNEQNVFSKILNIIRIIYDKILDKKIMKISNFSWNFREKYSTKLYTETRKRNFEFSLKYCTFFGAESTQFWPKIGQKEKFPQIFMKNFNFQEFIKFCPIYYKKNCCNCIQN